MPFFRRRRDKDDTDNKDGGYGVQQLIFKVLVIGAPGTGKTSYISRYVHNVFLKDYMATIGIDFALKSVQWNANTVVKLQLWDIAGQERYSNVTRAYYRGAHAAIVMFDCDDTSTFQAVSVWKRDLDSKVHLDDGSPLPCVLVANKCDTRRDLMFNASQMNEFCKEEGFLSWFETSAKRNIRVDESIQYLIPQMLRKERERQRRKNEENYEDNIAKLTTLSSERPKAKCC